MSPIALETFEPTELPTEEEVTILIAAIAARQRFTWSSLPRCKIAEDVSGADYPSHTPWLLNCPDKSSILETLLKFRVPPTALRNGKTYPPPKVRDSKLRKLFTTSMADVLSVSNDDSSPSVPTPSLSTLVATTHSPSAPPAPSPSRATTQYSGEPLERSIPIPHVETLESTSNISYPSSPRKTSPKAYVIRPQSRE